MAAVLGVGILLGVLGVLVFGVLAIMGRADPVKRRRWNGWVLGSFGLAVVSLVPFFFMR